MASVPEEKGGTVEGQVSPPATTPNRLFPLETRGLVSCFLLVITVISCSIWMIGLTFQQQCLSFFSLTLLHTCAMVVGVTILGVVLGDLISRLCRVDNNVYLATRAITWIPWTMHACGLAWIVSGFLWVKVFLPYSSGKGHEVVHCSHLRHFYHTWVLISMFILLSLSIVISLINRLLFIAKASIRTSKDTEKAPVVTA